MDSGKSISVSKDEATPNRDPKSTSTGKCEERYTLEMPLSTARRRSRNPVILPGK